MSYRGFTKELMDCMQTLRLQKAVYDYIIELIRVLDLFSLWSKIIRIIEHTILYYQHAIYD